MRKNPKGYVINIYDKLNSALVMCITFDLGYTSKHRAGEFYQLVITRFFTKTCYSYRPPS